MEKLATIQAARGIAAILVLIFHSASIHTKYVQKDHITPELLSFGQTGVDLFFVISGFVMIIAFQNRPVNFKQATEFFKARCFRIYPIYWVYCAAVLAVFFVAPGVVNSSQNGEFDLIDSLLLLPHKTMPLLMVAWTLVHEMWFYLVFAAILLFPIKFRPWLLLSWLLLIIYTAIFLETPSNPYLRVVAHTLSAEFIFGALAGLIYLKQKKPLTKKKISTPILIIISLTLLGYALTNDVFGTADPMQSVPLERVLTVGGGYTLLILALALTNTPATSTILRPLSTIGDISYSLYLSHILTLSACGRIWMAVTGPDSSSWQAVIFWIIAYPVVLASAYLSFHMIERPIIHWRARRKELHHMKTHTTA